MFLKFVSMTIFSYLIYFCYNLLKTDFSKLWRFACLVSEKKETTSEFRVLVDCFCCAWQHEMSPMDYFQMKMYRRSKQEWSEWAGTTFMYLAQSHLNSPGARDIFKNKQKFCEKFSRFVDQRRIVGSQDMNPMEFEAWITQNNITKLVRKPTDSQCGVGVEVYPVATKGGRMFIGDFDIVAFLSLRKGQFLYEAFIDNHEVIKKISPGCLNTLRLITFVERSGKPRFLAARMRFGRGACVDNLASGGIAAPVDMKSGLIIGPAVSSSPSENMKFTNHPVSGEKIVGTVVPYWDACLELVMSAAAVVDGARSIGWDVAITPEGPLLIEGNHNWCKILWQLPVEKGLRKEMEELLRN